jgi:hypothetical protein
MVRCVQPILYDVLTVDPVTAKRVVHCYHGDLAVHIKLPDQQIRVHVSL